MIKQIAKKLSLGKLVVLAISLLTMFLIVLFSSHILNPTDIRKISTSTYTNDINYRVYLMNNNFISQPSLGMDEAYISSMVNYITVHFKQSSSFLANSSLAYSYKIYAKLSATYHTESGKDTEIWNQVFPLKVQEKKNVEQNKLLVQEEVSIPYWDYQMIVDNFKNTYHLKTEVSLDVVMDIQYFFENDTTNVKSMRISIPMDQDVFEIATDYQKEECDSKTEKISNMSLPVSVVGSVLVILGIMEAIVCLFLFIKLLQIYSNTEYERVKRKIKKDYGSIIVDVDNAIDFSEFTIFEIKTIDELVDLEEELRIPILFYEKKKAGICYFVIIKDHYMYRFTLKDLEQEII